MWVPRDWAPLHDRAQTRRPRAWLITHSTRNALPARNDLHKRVRIVRLAPPLTCGFEIKATR